jgi:exopolyphosphatase/pppGpp-phosphohydrolase
MGPSLVTGSRSLSGTLGVLELGTNSLKLHLSSADPDRFEPHRVEWDVGFEVYSSRNISEETIASTIAQVLGLFGEYGVDPAKGPVFGIATGAFRDAENTPALLDRLYEEAGVPVRVLSLEEEASLLLEGAESLIRERPGIAFDLGGGSLEMVHLGSDGHSLRENLPVGAIRIFHLGTFASGNWDEGPAAQWIKKGFEKARAFQLPMVHGTGGTVKAIAQTAGSASIPMDTVRRIEETTRRQGAPGALSNRRRELFLPGLLVVRHLMEHVGAQTLQYTRVDLGEVLLSRLRPFRGVLGGPIGRSFLLQHLDIFRSEDRRQAARG